MPSIGFGEDKLEYAQRVVAWGIQQGVNTIECVRCADIRWKEWEANQLISAVENDHPGAIKKAIVKLLKDRYIP